MKDIINAALYFDSSRVRRLPCSWNLQLADNVDYAPCFHNDRLTGVSQINKLKILHWNRPIKALSPIETSTFQAVEMRPFAKYRSRLPSGKRMEGTAGPSYLPYHIKWMPHGFSKSNANCVFGIAREGSKHRRKSSEGKGKSLCMTNDNNTHLMRIPERAIT